MNRTDNLDFILNYLLSEQPRRNHLQIPDDLGEKQQLMRALENVRPPRPASDEFLRAEQQELAQQLAEKGIVTLPSLQPMRDPRIYLWQGDITRLQVDAIVNAANSALLGCWVPLHRCIDNAIHSAAGVRLREECHRLMSAQGHDEPTGAAKITRGYCLPARHVIHTVGPIISGPLPSAEQQEQLASCYRSCLKIADASALQSIAFCCISTGEFHFPNRLAAEIAIRTVRACLDAEMKNVRHVVFNVFTDLDRDIYRELLA